MKKIYLIQAKNVYDCNEFREWCILYAVETEEEAKADVARFRDEFKTRSSNTLYKRYYKYEEIDII